MRCAHWLVLAALAFAGSARADDKDARHVRNLVAVLRTTKSPATFVLTLKMLKDAGGDLRPVVPVALRGAERLGIFSAEPLEKLKDRAGAEVVADFIEAMGKKPDPSAATAQAASDLMTVLEGIGRAWFGSEEKKSVDRSDFRTPIIHPLIPGAPLPLCEDAPDEARVLRAWTKVCRKVPYIYEEHRDNIQIVPELITDKVEPAKWFPLVGMARLHRCHWKITIYYDEIIESSYPFPYRCKKPCVDVLYMDLDHLHLCACKNPEELKRAAKDLIAEQDSEKAAKKE